LTPDKEGRRFRGQWSATLHPIRRIGDRNSSGAAGSWYSSWRLAAGCRLVLADGLILLLAAAALVAIGVVGLRRRDVAV